MRQNCVQMHCDALCVLQSVKADAPTAAPKADAPTADPKADASTVCLVFNDSIKQMQFDEVGAQTHTKTQEQQTE